MEKIKKIFATTVVVLIIAGFIFLQFAIDRCTSKPSKEYTEEEIETIVNDPQWNVPSRYRE